MGHANSQITNEALLQANYAIVHVSPDEKKKLPYIDLGSGCPVSIYGENNPYVIIGDLRTALNSLSKATVVWDPQSKAGCPGYGPIGIPHGRRDFGLLFVIVLLIEGYQWNQYGISWIVPLIGDWPRDECRVNYEFLNLTMGAAQQMRDGTRILS
jgi:hypothetical protein